MKDKNDLCPCGSGAAYGECCQPIISGEKSAPTAEKLMRARYTAYAVCDTKFLCSSAGPAVQAEFDEKSTRNWSESAKWTGIEVLETTGGGENDEEGYVKFIANYSTKEQVCQHCEKAYFQKINGEWRFIDGEILKLNEPWRREQAKVGRNDECPCGSGKKYKKCCGKGK